MKYNIVTVGGTFDYLHEGHKTILRKAFAISERIIIGITSDRFAQKSRNDQIGKGRVLSEDFEKRRKEVERFLEKEGVRERARIVKIDDMFGPLKEVESRKSKLESGIEAMIVTRQTRENAEKINRWRRERGSRELDIVEVEMMSAEDKEPISSRRIRAGEINREGVVYRTRRLWGRLPRELREELRKPLGIAFSIPLKKALSRLSIRPLVAVGDISTKRLIEAGIKPDVAVFDLKVRRKKIFGKMGEIGISGEDYEVVKIKNPAGEVTEELYEFFSRFYNRATSRLIRKIGGGGRAGTRHIQLSHSDHHVMGKLRTIQVGNRRQLSHSDNHVDVEVRKIRRSGNRKDYLQFSRSGNHAGARGRNNRQGGEGSEFMDGKLERQVKVAVWIEGEEDLAALPAILFAPLGSVVVYGQPPLKTKNETLKMKNYANTPVFVEVTEERKEYVFSLLKQFKEDVRRNMTQADVG